MIARPNDGQWCQCRTCRTRVAERTPSDTPYSMSMSCTGHIRAARATLVSSSRKTVEKGGRQKGSREYWQICDTCGTEPCTSVRELRRAVTYCSGLWCRKRHEDHGCTGHG